MNTLHHTSDLAAQESPLLGAGQVVWRLDGGAPVAQAAEALLRGWKERPETTLVLVPEARQSAFLEALRPRILKLQADPGTDAPALESAVRRAADAGACLLAGGTVGRPALASNLLLNRQLLATLGSPTPMLLVGTLEENDPYLEALEPHLRGFPDPA